MKQDIRGKSHGGSRHDNIESRHDDIEFVSLTFGLAVASRVKGGKENG